MEIQQVLPGKFLQEMGAAYKFWCLATFGILYWQMSGDDQGVHPAKIDWQTRLERQADSNRDSFKHLSDEELDRQIAEMKKKSA